MSLERLIHPWPATFDADSRVLILGTFPSPKSREFGYPYGHPQNIFWTALARSLGVAAVPPGAGGAERQAWLLQNRVALWDVIYSCTIEGASDASIRDPIPNRFAPIIAGSQVQAIFTTGRKATDLFNSLCTAEAGMPAAYLPSTSPANRAAQARPQFWELWAEPGRVVRGTTR